MLWKTPEEELLVCAARTRLPAAAARRMRVLLQTKLDWVYLLEAAHSHGTLPLLYHHLQAVCPDSPPAPVLDYLRASCERTGQFSLYLTSELFRILATLQNQGVLALPYKGPVLAALAYGNLGLRTFEDLDIILRQHDVRSAWDALASLDYRSTSDGLIDPIQWPARIPGQYAFQQAHGPCVVELHTERTLRYFPRPLDFEGSVKTLRPVVVGGQEVLTFSPEQTLVLICVHGAKHFWNRLLWICDVSELAQLPGMDWERAFDHARSLGCERIVLLGLHLANQFLGTRLPEPVSRKAHESAQILAQAAVVSHGLFNGRDPGLLERFLFRLRMPQSLWTGLRYTLRLATMPTATDWQALRLPQPLAPLVRLLRPYRLWREYGWQAGQSSSPSQADHRAMLDEISRRLLADTRSDPRPGVNLLASKLD